VRGELEKGKGGEGRKEIGERGEVKEKGGGERRR